MRSANQPSTRLPAALEFVPAVVAPPTPEPVRPVRRARRDPVAGIELDVAGVTVRVGPDASAAQIAAVIRALKATR